jgi:transaldolase/glucose-6-phosphate isomerase
MDLSKMNKEGNMGNPAIDTLTGLGQSIWYDNIQRRLLETGEMGRMISNGEIRGVTSNPTIFHNAISKTSDYDSALKPMAWSGWKAEVIFYQLAVEDIRNAADLFRPLYDETNGADGYVSLEVSPFLAHNTKKTLAEAKRLWEWVNRPNLMVKIPATLEGLPAIQKAIAVGININVTLIFSLERYNAVLNAYITGLEERVKAGLSVNRIASVASFFVSRMDTKIDARLQNLVAAGGEQAKKASAVMGKAAIANARLAYDLFEHTVSTARWKKLAAHDANVQRPLWASTSTKNPAYKDVVYIEALIGPFTVNTVPPLTLDAFKDHGISQMSLAGKVDESRKTLADLENLGISIQQVTDELEKEGVKSFSDSFGALLKSIQERVKAAQKELGGLKARVVSRVAGFEKINYTGRLFDHDPSLWTQDPKGQEEVRKRLGWLDSPVTSQDILGDLKEFAYEVHSAGFTHALLLGMGGSSLAPEVYGLTLDHNTDGLVFSILDSTDPGQVLATTKRFPLRSTLFIISSKSGSTAEINAFLEYYWKKVKKIYKKQAGQQFIAITDPGTSLEKLARERGFRKIFAGDPNVGGRFSALTAFGLVPAALNGVNVDKLLTHALRMRKVSLPDTPAGRNPGLVMGAILGEAFLDGKDKLTILTDSDLTSLGSWMEQLIAESSGKQGKGIVPVDIEPVVKISQYGNDRMFVYFRTTGHKDRLAKQLTNRKHPVIVIQIRDPYELGAEFYRWEMAIAAACSIMQVNAFDQPAVQDNKTRTIQKMDEYKTTGKITEPAPFWKIQGAACFGAAMTDVSKVSQLIDMVDNILKQTRPGDTIFINAYLPRDERNLKLLQNFRKYCLQKTGSATTLGFGPRFLHSTGQLHKGGSDKCLIIQLTQDAKKDVEIPTMGLSFGTLEHAQALGDFEALVARGRRAYRIHLDGKKVSDLHH